MGATERIILRQRKVWQTWSAMILTLLIWWLLVHGWQWPRGWLEVEKLSFYLVAGLLLGLGLKQLMNPEALAVAVDYRAGQVTHYKLGIRWKTILPLTEIHCQLTRQTNHKGYTHFLVVTGRQGQWAIQESTGWPLSQLVRLQNLLTFDV